MNHYKTIVDYWIYQDSWPTLISPKQGQIQDLKLGSDMNVSSRWSIVNVKKVLQTDSSFVFSFMFSLDK